MDYAVVGVDGEITAGLRASASAAVRTISCIVDRKRGRERGVSDHVAFNVASGAYYAAAEGELAAGGTMAIDGDRPLTECLEFIWKTFICPNAPREAWRMQRTLFARAVAEGSHAG